MCDWTWNYNKTRKLQVSCLREIRVRYNDDNMRRNSQERRYSAIGIYAKTFDNIILPEEIILFTSDDNSECVKFVDSITGIKAQNEQNEYRSIDMLVDRFLVWPLPNSVSSDLCTTTHGTNRIGTNLLTATEAKQMLEYVLGNDHE